MKTLKKVINKWLGAVMRLKQKTNFKNKVSDSNYREINPNFFFKWNSKFWSSLGKKIYFSLQEGVTRMMLAKFHQNLRFWKISVNFYRNSTHRSSPNFRSKSISILDKFLWGKLFLISISFYPYFIYNFWN